jgi:hypothetical protein
MKTIYTTFFLFFFLITFSQAPRGFYLAGGINNSTLKTDYFNTDSEIGYNAGIIFVTGNHESYNFQFDFLYSQRINSFEGTNTFNNTDFNNVNTDKYSAEGLEMGFYGNYYILKPDEDKFFVGPQIGLNCNILSGFEKKDSSEDNPTEYLLPYNISDNKLKFSKVNVCAGFGLTGGYNRFKFDLRYNLGLSNVLSNLELENYNSVLHPEGKLSDISLNISFLLFHSK